MKQKTEKEEKSDKKDFQILPSFYLIDKEKKIVKELLCAYLSQMFVSTCIGNPQNRIEGHVSWCSQNFSKILNSLKFSFKRVKDLSVPGTKSIKSFSLLFRELLIILYVGIDVNSVIPFSKLN